MDTAAWQLLDQLQISRYKQSNNEPLC